MPTFLVERFLPAPTSDSLQAVVGACARAAASLRAEGVPVEHLESTLLAGDESCLCLFRAPDADAVRLANARAGLAFERIVEAERLAGLG